jgi:hypothetical protein
MSSNIFIHNIDIEIATEWIRTTESIGAKRTISQLAWAISSMLIRSTWVCYIYQIPLFVTESGLDQILQVLSVVLIKAPTRLGFGLHEESEVMKLRKESREAFHIYLEKIDKQNAI